MSGASEGSSRRASHLPREAQRLHQGWMACLLRLPVTETLLKVALKSTSWLNYGFKPDLKMEQSPRTSAPLVFGFLPLDWLIVVRALATRAKMATKQHKGKRASQRVSTGASGSHWPRTSL